MYKWCSRMNCSYKLDALKLEKMFNLIRLTPLLYMSDS